MQPGGSPGAAASSDPSAPIWTDDEWEVFWCYDGWHPPADRLEKMLPPWAKLRRMDPKVELWKQVGHASVLIPTTGTVDAEVIEAAPKCVLIAQPAAGYCNIDVAKAKERKIPITIAPGLNSASVAEHALMLILMLHRRVEEGRAVFQQGRIGEPVGRELGGKTLGIIGLGRVGRCLARAAEALGMKVIGIDSGSSRQELEGLLQSADVVSLHCPLNESTQSLISREELGMMKREALLINCARGPVIDKDALLEALEAGSLGGVGLDVHWVEPADPTEPIYQFPNVIATPHMGTITEEVYDRFAWILKENIVRRREGRELLNQLC